MVSADQALVALGGAFVGGVIAQIGQLLQVSREKRKVLNRVLHSQLEIWFMILRADPQPLIEMVTRLLVVRLGGEASQLEMSQLRSLFSQLYLQLVPQVLPVGLEGRYRSAVDEAAEVDPLLAYQLGGKTELAKYIQTWRPKLEAWTNKLQASGADRRGIAKAEAVVDQALRATVLKALETDILEVSRAVNRRTRRGAARALEKAKSNPDKITEAELDDFLDRVFAAAQVVPRSVT